MKAITIAVAVVLLAAMAYVISPYWTVHQMRSAAESGQGDRLAQYVDFPAVRESMKAQVLTFMTKSMEEGKLKDNSFAGLVQMMATAMIGPMVDAMVTPDTLAMMIDRGKAPPTKLSNETSQPSNSSPTPATQPEPSLPSKAPRISQGYEGLDVFKVAVHDPEKDEDLITMILIRNGWFGWKLTSVRLPALVTR